MRALLSVYDKTGVEELARALAALGFDLVASGGTSGALTAAGIDHVTVESVTGAPEILGGRVKTLHPAIHGGILADLDKPAHLADLEAQGITPFELVVCNLYPFRANPSIELIDVGGPTMVRAAAKNHAHVGVLVDPADYGPVLDELRESEDHKLSDGTRRRLARKAFAHTAAYDAAITTWFDEGDPMPDSRHFTLTDGRGLRYGENAWQVPAVGYAFGSPTDPLAIPDFQLLRGNPGFINYVDVDRLLQIITHIAAGFEVNFGQVPLIAVGVKHGNACGAAVGFDAADVIRRMLEGSLEDIHGGYVMTNFPITEELAQLLRTYKSGEKKRILDGVLAPEITEPAQELLKRKGEKCSMFVNHALSNLGLGSLDTGLLFRRLRGLVLTQPNYCYVLDLSDPAITCTDPEPMSTRGHYNVVLAWAICATSNSNTITLVDNWMLIGNGVGQQSRVGAATLALARAAKAGHSVRGATACSDSFFPFPDGPLVLAEAGVAKIFATSGSLNDEAVQKAMKRAGVQLVQLPDRMARGFFGH